MAATFRNGPPVAVGIFARTLRPAIRSVKRGGAGHWATQTVFAALERARVRRVRPVDDWRSAANGALTDADWVLTRALSLAEAAGADDALRASLLTDAGMARLGCGDLAAAAVSLRRALRLDEGTWRSAPDDEQRRRMGSVLEVLGNLAQSESRLDEAEALLRRALGLDAASAGSRLPRQTSLATLLLERGRGPEAESIAPRALRDGEREFGRYDAHLVEPLNALGMARAGRGDVSGAQKLLRRASRLGELAPATPALRAATYANLGLVRMAAQRYPEAELLLERALDLAESSMGPAHPAPVRLLQSLGDCYRLRNRLGDAQAVYERALRLCSGPRRSLGAPALSSLAGLAQVAERGGQDAYAERLHRDALALADRKLAASDPRRAVYLGNLAAFYGNHGAVLSARRLYAEALALFPERLRGHDPRQRWIVEGLSALPASRARGAALVGRD